MKVWEATLDDEYLCEVVKTSEYDGVLNIRKKDAQGAKRLRYSTGVKLTAGAIFGADVVDTAEWESICVNYVDNLKETDT